MNRQSNQILDEIELLDNIQCTHADNLSAAQNILDVNKLNSFHIISANIRSIYCNIDRFLVFLTELQTPMEVIVLSECWTNSDTTLPTIDGYNTYSSRTSFNQNDGVVVFVKDDLEAYCMDVNIEEGNCVLINIANDTSIICTYRPPSFTHPIKYINSLNDLLGSITTRNVIITGDVNINILPGSLNSTANEYLNIMAYHGLKQGVDKPTRLNSCLDHFMVKTSYHCQTIVFGEFTDHSPILLKLEKPAARKRAAPMIKYSVDYEKVRTNILELDWYKFYNMTDVNLATEFLVLNLKIIVLNNTTMTHISSKNRPLKPWISVGLVK